MNNEPTTYIVEITEQFNKEMKRFVKKKNFRKLPKQVADMVEDFKQGNITGDLITQNDIPLPYAFYKKRLPNEDTNSGTSNGYRVLYPARHEENSIALLSIIP